MLKNNFLNPYNLYRLTCLNHTRIIFILVFVNICYSNILFTDVTANSGINFSGQSEGVCVFDYNNDGLDDIFFTTRSGSRLYLYKNEGGMSFSDVTFDSNLGIVIEGRTPVAGDYDNDGDLDLFIGNANGQSLLFQNDGSGHFQDVTSISGVNVTSQVRGCSWVDYDSDGFLDLYVGLLTTPNKMFRNNGDGTFVDVAQNIGVEGPISAGVVMGLGFIDYDRDGDQDLFITQDNNLGNILLKNENGFFIDVSNYSDVNLNVMGMGVAFGDINRDGYFDFYTTNLYENSLLLNSETTIFSDISESSGTEDIPGSMGWGTFFFDANNDGWVDIYNNNETGFGGIPNSLFINNTNSTFTMVDEEAGVVLSNNGYGSAFGDFDLDGDLDIILVGHSSQAGSINLLRNDSDTQNWIIFNLTRENENRFSVGATVELFNPDGRQLNFIAAGNGYCSQNTNEVHFGLGEATQVDSIKVFWPDGQVEVFTNFSINSRHTVVKGTSNNLGIQSLNELERTNKIISSIYPNPVNNNFTLIVNSDLDSKGRISIYDLRGVLVKEFNIQLKENQLNSINLNLQNEKSGVYFIKIQTDYFTDYKKITLVQ